MPAVPRLNWIRRRRLAVLASIAGLVVGAPAHAAGPVSDALPPDLAAAAADYDRAQIQGDRAALERLVAEDYVLVNSGGQVQGRGDLIAGYATPGNSIEPYVVEDKVERMLGADGAVLAGAVNLKGLSDGAPFKGRIRFADIWRRRQGRWQVIFTEVTRIPPAR